MDYFEYYEIRCCVDHGGEILSFTGAFWCPEREQFIGTPKTALREARLAASARLGSRVFWTLYGRWMDGTAEAIGDFKTFEDAYRIMQGILMAMRKAADMVANDDGYSAADAGAMLEDICNQSTTEERL